MDRPFPKLVVWGSSALLLAGLTALCGCESADPGTPPPVAGGQEFILDEAVFAATVNPILTRKGCDNLACHGGGLRGSLQLSPFNDKNVDFDFEQVSRQLNPLDPEASSILTKPLAQAAGGAVHTAPSEQYGFMTTDDPDYQAILAWIQAGELR
jgi:hypothetical protein